MSFFQKSKEPKELRAWIRANEPIRERTWEDLPGKEKSALRTRAYHDQRGLCCYCYKIIGDDHTSHVEHIQPQSSENRFDWENLALACDGGNLSGNPPHCDHSKGNQLLAVVHPYKAPVARVAELRSTGRLQAEQAARRDVEDVLNLNAAHLERQRKAALEAATADLTPGKRRRRDKEWKARPLEKVLEDLKQRSKPLDYQPLIEKWLEHRLRRA